MSWKQQLFKPKWQHKNPDIRREAVASLSENALIQALPDISANDEDKSVRLAAVKRIDDPQWLAELLKKEAETENINVIRLRIIALCTSKKESRPSLASRQSALSEANFRDLIEAVAVQAPEPELRKLALSKVERQGLLGDRAALDPDPTLRRFAASLINQISTLRRVIENTRKTDKSLHLELQERLHEELLESGDAGAIQTEALAQCEALEAFSLQHLSDPEKVPAGIAARWSKIEKLVIPETVERYKRIAEYVSQVHEIPVAQTTEAAIEEAVEETQAEADPVLPVDPVAETAEKTEEEPKKEVKAPAASKKPVVEADPAKIKAIAEAQALLPLLDRQLEDGELHKALESKHRISEMSGRYKGDRDWKQLNNEVGQRQPRIRELLEWQHWSNDKIRKTLIKEMEVLPQAGLHPDALLDRVKSLQSQWKALELSEQVPGDSRHHTAHWMWRKFKTAGNQAFEAAKPFLEKRDEIRDKKIDAQKALCAQLTEMARSENPDRAELTKLLQSARNELRELDNLPHKLRKPAAARIRRALDTGNASMKSHYETIEKQKLKLIREAAQLVHVEEHDDAIREAKRLQAEWKSAGRLWRARENELWTLFREPLDPLFETLKSAKESAQAEIKERLASQEALCQSMQAILDGKDDQLVDSGGNVQGLIDEWKDIEQPNQRLQKQFQLLSEKFHQRVSQIKSAEVNAVRQGWWDKAQLLHKLEAGKPAGELTDSEIKKAKSQWPNIGNEEIDEVLNHRFNVFLENNAAPSTAKDANNAAIGICIQLEFLAGLASPKSEKEQRMKYQVDRLSKSLSGEGGRLSAIEEAGIAEQEWLKLPFIQDKAYQKFEARIKTALEEIYRTNSV